MKSKIKYAFLFFGLVKSLCAQELQLNLSKGHCSFFSGNLFSYGLFTQKQHAAFCIYKLDKQLKIKDSLVVDLGKKTMENYLGISADTLHNYLNVYLQEKEKKLVTIFRFSKRFELAATVENVDIARLNNTAMFDAENLYFKNAVYTIKIQNDTSGKQFYLNKYELRSEKQNFDYAFSWQLPFEKKNIHSAHIFFADKNYVLVYVYIDSGLRAGQWVLKINAASGKLLRGTKLNGRSETATYMFDRFIADSVSKSIHLLGQKFSETQFSQKDNKLTISNAPFAFIYLASIDSTGDITFKQDFKIPITNSVVAGKKTKDNFLLKIDKPVKTKEGSISFEADIYKNSDNSLCYLYANTTLFNLLPAEDKMILEKNTVMSNPLIEKFYFTNDKMDMNGRLCIDSLNQFEKIFYKKITFPVKQSFKTDNDKNPAWILTKGNAKKNSVNFTFLNPVKKIYQLTLIDEIPKSMEPELLVLPGNSFLIGKQSEDNKYQLKLFSW